jgi:hypothetical protein
MIPLINPISIEKLTPLSTFLKDKTVSNPTELKIMVPINTSTKPNKPPIKLKAIASNKN